LRAQRDNQKELAEQIDAMAATTADVARLVLQVQVPRREIPSSPEGFANFTKDACKSARGALIKHQAGDLSTQEKRILLRWVGVRVEVRNRDEAGPDGTHWDLIFETQEGAGPFPLDNVGFPVQVRERSLVTGSS
jgi:hypothetical protein